MPLSPGTRLGRYVIERRIASGGMANVYLARGGGAAGFEKRLLVKVLRPELAEQKKFVDMLVDEARIAARLDHENIVHVYDFDEDGGRRFIVMEYVHGLDLARILDRLDARGERVPPRFAAAIAMRIARGLSYAHSHEEDGQPLGIVHRDVNPHNVILSAAGEVKILDFGIAKARRRISKTEFGDLKGKVLYMTPEQAAGTGVDARTDVYALGMVLYELLTGIPLLQSDTDIEAIVKARAPKVPAPSELADVDADLEAIVSTCLAVDAGQRFQSAAELEDRLHAYLQEHHEPVRPRDLAVWIEPMLDAEKRRPVTDVLPDDDSQPITPSPPDEGPPAEEKSQRQRGGRRPLLWALGGALAVTAILFALGLASLRFLQKTEGIAVAGATRDAQRVWRLPERIPADHAVVQSSVPGALVFVDGTFAGRSPTTVGIAGDRARVTASLPGHRDWSGWARTTSQAGRFLTPEPAAATGAIRLPETDSEPILLLDGLPVNAEESVLHVRPGLRRIEWRFPESGQGGVALVTVVPGETVEVEFASP